MVSHRAQLFGYVYGRIHYGIASLWRACGEPAQRRGNLGQLPPRKVARQEGIELPAPSVNQDVGQFVRAPFTAAPVWR